MACNCLWDSLCLPYTFWALYLSDHHFLCILCSITTLSDNPGASKAMLLPPGLPASFFTDSPGLAAICAAYQHFLGKESYLRNHKERGYCVMAVTQGTRIIWRETLLPIHLATFPSPRGGDAHTLPM